MCRTYRVPDAMTRAVDREMREFLKMDESLDLSAMRFTAEQQQMFQKYIDDQNALIATIDASRARIPFANSTISGMTCSSIIPSKACAEKHSPLTALASSWVAAFPDMMGGLVSEGEARRTFCWHDHLDGYRDIRPDFRRNALWREVRSR